MIVGDYYTFLFKIQPFEKAADLCFEIAKKRVYEIINKSCH